MKHLILILLCFSQIAICQENKNIAGKITTSDGFQFLGNHS
jgi:hypothetical protein